MATTGGKIGTLVIWIVCILLYVFALLTHFGVLKTTGDLGDWAWIVGFGLLLIAVRVGDD